MKNSLGDLIKIAKQKMKHSSDPIHDLKHVENVVTYVKTLVKDTELSSKQKNSLILAAWWHDVSRTIPKKTSFVWMPFLDDIISAFLLSFYTAKMGLLNDVTFMSFRLIICKSLGTGAFFTKVLFKKKNRYLINILKDADALDILGIERMKKTLELIETSKVYYLGYKTATWWFITRDNLKMKTEIARKYLEELIRKFIEWVTSKEVKEFFEEKFGKKWAHKMLTNINKMLDTITLLNLQTK
jgi:hypothetical protein